MTPKNSAIFLVASLLLCGPALAQDEGTYKPGTTKPKAPPAKAPAKTTPKAPPKPAPSEKLKEDGKAIFSGSGDSSSNPDAAASSAWSIVIQAFHGDSADADAAEGLTRVRTETSLAGAYIEKRGNGTLIVYGRYADPASPQAKADLAKVRAVQVMMDGSMQTPFASAFLAPPAEIKGSLPEFDLNNAKKLSGDWAIYTLQIGVYSREDKKAASAAELAEFRRTAEQAVIQLRREGEQAFYAHGPNRSMVTVGLFGEEDFDPASKVESPTLRILRQRYPYNLQNGMGIKHTRTATDPKTGRQVRQEQIAKSGLVRVPDSETPGTPLKP